MTVGCVIRRHDLSEEVVLTAEQMARYGNSPDARKALRGPCVYVLYAASADALMVGSARHVIKRWNTLDAGSPEPLRLIMVWRAPDQPTAEKQEAHLHQLLASFAVPDRRNWYRAAPGSRVLMGLTSWEPPTDAEPKVPVHDLVREMYRGETASTMVTGLTERMFQRLDAWNTSRSGVDLRRVHVTLAALRSEGCDPDEVLAKASRVSDPDVQEQVREFSRVYNLIRA